MKGVELPLPRFISWSPRDGSATLDHAGPRRRPTVAAGARACGQLRRQPPTATPVVTPVLAIVAPVAGQADPRSPFLALHHPSGRSPLEQVTTVSYPAQRCVSEPLECVSESARVAIEQSVGCLLQVALGPLLQVSRGIDCRSGSLWGEGVASRGQQGRPGERSAQEGLIFQSLGTCSARDQGPPAQETRMSSRRATRPRGAWCVNLARIPDWR